MAKGRNLKAPLDITVSIRCVNDPLPQFRDCLEALANQEGVAFEVFVIDSSEGDGHAKLCAEFADFVTHERLEGDTRLNAGRNRGTELATTDLVALTDPDTIPDPTWLAALKSELDAGATVTGGKTVPRWIDGTPPWHIRRSSIARTTLALMELGDEILPDVGRAFGANMAFSKSAMGEVCHFDLGLDRQGGLLLGGGDTEFCDKAVANGGRVSYTPHARVQHQLPASRVTSAYFSKKLYWDGVTRSHRGGAPRPVKTKRHLIADCLFLARYLPAYYRGLRAGKIVDLAKVGS